MKVDAFSAFSNRSARVLGVVCIAGCALSVLSCGETSDEDPAGVGTRTGEIINGANLDGDGIGTPIISSLDRCTGTLIRNNWVLTAKHCLLNGSREVAPSEVAAAIKGGPTQLGAERIVRHRDANGDPNNYVSVDVALVKFSAPLTDVWGNTFKM